METSSTVITLNLVFNSLYVPKEETLPSPLGYFDVTRSTHTNLDVMQEKRVDDDWKVCWNRSFSDSWTGFTNFTLLTNQGKTDKSSNDYEIRSRVAKSVDKSQRSLAKARNTRMGSRKTQARECAQNERNFILLTLETKHLKRP